MILAYAAAREAAPGHLVLYRVGEFYEVLHEAALTVSRALGIQLTRRRQKDAPDVPMCGIPASSSAAAIARLLTAGHKVAVSEQAVDDGPRPLRLMTPATSVEAGVIAEDRANNLVVAHAEDDAVGLAWIDLSTSESGLCRASLNGVAAALARIGPSEILVSRWPDGSDALATAVRSSGASYSNLRHDDGPAGGAGMVLAEAYGADHREKLRGCSSIELTALVALLAYVRITVGDLPRHLPLPRQATMGDTMAIDAPTLRGLEVLTSASGREGSLLSVLDRTVTPAGARLLARQLAAPLTDPRTIERRLAMVRFLVAEPQVRSDCREGLGQMPDMLRACGRLSLGKAGPRDLAAVRDGLDGAMSLAAILQRAPGMPAGLGSVSRDFGVAGAGGCGDLARVLRRAVTPQPPATVKEPGFVAAGYVPRLDAARSDLTQAKQAIQDLQDRYVGQTGIKGLRIRTNMVVGYHVEVPSTSAKLLDDRFTLRQGLASSTRFTTAELDGFAGRLEEASGRVEALELAAFSELSNAVLTVRDAVARVASAAAALDLVAGLAQAAAEGLWSEPEMVDDVSLSIDGGRHPVAERLLEAEGRAFVANDCRMEEENRLWLLTGPNMAGKSTFLRQVAVIVLMAQVGSFVPAKRARIGVVDKMFSRIGASDDLAAGRSTFLVEMLETAAILSQATSRSFVILDEVGRGTSTHDGLAIAQSCMEYLHDVVGCRTLFATHYHELADAADGMACATCMAMAASAGRHGEAFTYQVTPGRSGQSFGLNVAALAGMPSAVLERAASLLAERQTGK